DELLQASQPGRHGAATAPVGEGHLTDVDVAARVDGEPVRRDELAGLEPRGAIAESREQLALPAVNADARPDVGHVQVDGDAAPDFAHVEAALRATLQEQTGGAAHVVPLRLVLPVAVEHLD